MSDFMMTRQMIAPGENENLLDYYKNLLIVQYNDKTKARKTIRVLVDATMIYDIMVAIRDGFDLDTAIGKQLDILGKYIGSDRVITGTAFTRDYFGYVEYSDVVFAWKGYTEYKKFIPTGSYFGARRYGGAAFNYFPLRLYSAAPSSVATAQYRTFTGTLQGTVPDVQFFSYRNSTVSLFELNDQEFRAILKLLIIKNYGTGSAKDIDELIASTLGEDIIFTDRQNMSISYIFPEDQTRFITIAKSEGVLPRPSGVGMSVAFTKYINAIFSYGTYGNGAPSFAVGYSEYGKTPIGGMSYYG